MSAHASTPARFVERVQVAAARERLERTTAAIEAVVGRSEHGKRWT